MDGERELERVDRIQAQALDEERSLVFDFLRDDVLQHERFNDEPLEPILD